MILETNKEYIYIDKFEHIVVWVLMGIGLSIFLEFVRALIIVWWLIKYILHWKKKKKLSWAWTFPIKVKTKVANPCDSYTNLLQW